MYYLPTMGIAQKRFGFGPLVHGIDHLCNLLHCIGPFEHGLDHKASIRQLQKTWDGPFVTIKSIEHYNKILLLMNM